jgi:phosphate transport system permease protein
MNTRLRWRKLVSVFMLTMTGVCSLVAVSVLFFILGYLVFHGGRSINWDFFTKLPTPVGESGGGMANAIVGSAKLLFLASLVGVPIGFFGASTSLSLAGPRLPSWFAMPPIC